MLEELNRRIVELKQKEEDIHRRSCTIFWYITQHEKADLILPVDRDLLSGWEQDEEDLMVYLGTMLYSFSELEAKISTCDNELLATVTTALQMRLGTCEVTSQVLDFLVDGDIDDEENEEYRFPSPEEIINATNDIHLLFAFALHGMNTIANDNPLPFEAIYAIAQDPQASAPFQEWMFPALDHLYGLYKRHLG